MTSRRSTIAPRSAPTSATRLSLADLDSVAPIVFSALVVVLMLELTRVFVATMLFVIDQSHREVLAANAFGSYLLGALAIPLVARLGGRWTLIGSTALVLTARLAIQFTDQPSLRFRLAQLATIACIWLLLPLLMTRRAAVAQGVALGLALDLVLRFSATSIDLPWMTTPLRSGLTVVLAAAAAYFLWRILRSSGEPSVGGSAIGALAIGPAIGLHHLVTGNIGIAVIRGNLTPALMGSLLVLGAIAGLGLKPGARQDDRPDTASTRAGMAIGFALLCGLALWLFWSRDGIANIALGGASAMVIALLLAALTGGLSPTPSSPLATGLWLAGGLLVQTAILFQYFQLTGMPLLIGILLLLLALAAVVAVRPASTVTTPIRPIRMATAGLAAALLIAFTLTSGSWSEPAVGAPLTREVTVLTYNIQAGFSRGNDWDLEQTARAIERENPDVVVLQEVSRGWLIMTGADQLAWLSQRLGMRYAWGPSSRDSLWGVAILSKAPIHDAAMSIYPSTVNLRRGALSAQIETEAGDLWIITTHLDDGASVGATREEQVAGLLAAWDGRTPVVIAGDFNAEPDTGVVGAMTAAGFTDTLGAVDPGAATFEDGSHIDYIFTNGPLELRDAYFVDSWASDHRPVVAKVILVS